jgi:NADH:ubiquinone oxidoreductase subunit 6 (subunit J)
MVAGVIEEIGLHMIKRYFGFFTIAVIVLIVAFVLIKRRVRRSIEALEEDGPFHD